MSLGPGFFLLFVFWCSVDLGPAGPVRAAPAQPPFITAVPKPSITSPLLAANAARACLLSEYARGKTGLRCFAYAKPQGLVNWSAPKVDFQKDLKTRDYRGPAWIVGFIAPRPPGASPHVIALPGNDFSVMVAQDGRFLGMIQPSD